MQLGYLLVYLTELLRLPAHKFVVDTLLNFPMPFNIILIYTNTSCLLV